MYLRLKKQLQEAGVEDAGFDVEQLIRHVAGRSRFELNALTPAQLAALEALATRRAQRQPLQYLLGTWPFLGLELKVGPGVLIPRGETEQVCLAAAQTLAGVEAPAVLDLCAGAGALALGIQSCVPGARVTAVELYPEAFAYLEANIAAFAESHASAPCAVQADVCTYGATLPTAAFHLIVSNPPYVSEQEYATLAPELAHEPRTALVAGQGGLAFYHAIAQGYRHCLVPGGHLVFELGAGQGPAVAARLAQSGYGGIRLLPDTAGHTRIAVARAAE